MTDFYRQRLAHAHWTWMEAKFCRAYHRNVRKLRKESRVEKHRARQDEKRDIEDQIMYQFDPLDDYDLCTDRCCVDYVPGVGIVRKRWSF